MGGNIRAARRFDKIESDIDMLQNIIRDIFQNGKQQSSKWINSQLHYHVYGIDTYKSLPQKFQQRIHGYIDAFNDMNN